MLRFAPSPTRDMDIADLRVALFNYIVSKQKNEDFIIRIEDTEKEKNIEGKDQEFLDILGLFGIEYSQVIYQSENVRFHTAMALQLMHEKKAFSCFCSQNWLDNKREEAKEKKQAYKYDDACANLPAELVIDNTSPFTIRVKKPTSDITIKDYIKGDVSFKSQDEDSFIILNENKTPTSNFASAVDDMLSDISLVIRDEIHFDKTSKQDHIRASLKYDKKIEYAHLPAILNDEKVSVKSLLEDGFLPEAIVNYLIGIGNETPKEIFTFADAKEFLDLEKISSSPTRFDINVLKKINYEHLNALDSKELSRYVGFADEDIGELAKIYLKEVSTTKELKSKIAAIFAQKEIPAEHSERSAIIIKAIKTAPYFDNYDDFTNYLLNKSAIKEEEFFIALRLVLTGATKGPELELIYKYIKNYIGEIVK